MARNDINEESLNKGGREKTIRNDSASTMLSCPDHDCTETERNASTKVMLTNESKIIRFAPGDSEDPLNWAAVRRWSIVVAVSLMNMISILATTMIVPAAPQVVADFRAHSNLYRTLLVTIWDLGEGVGPFFAAPLAERYGRSPVFHTGNLLGVICIIACAMSTNISMLVAFRFLGGCFFTAPTLAPAIIGDVIRPKDRGKAMAIGMGLRQLAPFAAPISGAYINQNLGWRWIFWILAIVIAVVGAFALVVVRETYAVKILERKTRKLQQRTGNPQLRSVHQSQIDANAAWQSVARPALILLLSPSVFLISFYTGLVCGIQFLVITTLTPTMEEIYGFSQGSVGLTYIAACVGYVIGMLLYGTTSDRYVNYRRSKDGEASAKTPEYRLLHMLIGSCSLPVGLLVYGWTLAYHVHYIVPLIGTSMIALSMLLAVLPSENFLVDACEFHSASAVAACMIMRAVFGATFPLLGPPLYTKLGLGWGNSLLSLISAVFIPPLLLLLQCGKRIRRWELSHGRQID